MSTLLDRPGAATAAPTPSRRRRWGKVGAVVAALLLAKVVYLANLEPLVQGGSYGEVEALGNAQVHELSPPLGETTFIARYRGGDELRVSIGLQNSSWLPVRLEDVRTHRSLDCDWAPTQQHLRTGPDAGALDAPRIELDSYLMRPGEEVVVELSGAFIDGCSVPLLRSIAKAEITTRILGLPRSHAYELPYKFGWAEDPKPALDIVD